MGIRFNNKNIFDRNIWYEYNDCMDNDDKLTFQSVLDASKLNEKQYLFFKNLVDPESDTLGDIVSSYHKAGYTENPTSKYAAYRIYQSEKFQRVLTAYRHKEVEKKENRGFTMLERVTEGLTTIANKAERTGDLSVHRQALMDLAKLHGLLVDRHQMVDPAEQLEVDKSMRLEAARLAQQRLLPDTMPVIDVDCLAKSSNELTETALEPE